MDERAGAERLLNVGVAYATPQRQLWLEVEVRPGATVEDAIRESGILDQFPEIDLDQQKVGVFGKIAKLTDAVAEGDRVEIYRPITADPKQVRRKRAGKGGGDDGGDDGGGNDD